MSTDGSYVGSHAQVRYVDAGGAEGGMISDAQAAELLMRVSEQRPSGYLADASGACVGASVPYVQVKASLGTFRVPQFQFHGL